MKIAMIGLGKMGGAMSRRLIDAGHEVVGMDLSPDNIQAAADMGVVVAESRDEVIVQMEKPIIWLMIPSQFVAEEIEAWLHVLPQGSILVDGGNSRFQQTVEHGEIAQRAGIRFVDVGVSGGVKGLESGYSLMAGGDESAYKELQPVFEALAHPGGYGYFGAHGVGHFVKMVHNAIEYGMMEAYAEGFELIEHSDFKDVDLAQLSSVWQNGSIISSFLNQLSLEIFTENRHLEGIEGKVNMLGEAQWASEYAQENAVPLVVVDHAIERRSLSMKGQVSFATKYLAALRNKFGGHALNKTSSENPDLTKNI